MKYISPNNRSTFWGLSTGCIVYDPTRISSIIIDPSHITSTPTHLRYLYILQKNKKFFNQEEYEKLEKLILSKDSEIVKLASCILHEKIEQVLKRKSFFY